MLHLASGAIGFLALATAALVIAIWWARRQAARLAWYSRASGTVIIVGFLAGSALATDTSGVVAVWVAVVVGWLWLAAISTHLYRTVPHPDAHRRGAATS